MILIEGFDHIESTDTHLADKWREPTIANVGFTSTTPHGAGKALYLNATNDIARVKPENIYYSVPSYPQGVVGFHIRMDNVAYSSNYPFFRLIDSSNNTQMGLRMSLEGRVVWERGSTPIYQSKGYRYNDAYTVYTSDPSTWIHVEVKYSISNYIGSNTCTVTIDGSTVLVLPIGMDTQALTTNVVNGIWFYPSNYARYVDNVYWSEGSSTLNNGGGVYVQTLPASGDYTILWSEYPGVGEDHYQDVDDSTPDDDSTYVYSSVTDNRETFAFGKIQQYDGFPYDCETSPSIAAIQLVSRVKREAGNDEGHFKHIIENASEGWSYEPSNTGHVTTSYRYYMSISNICPSTSSAWTRDTMNSHYFGVERGDYIV